MDIKQVKQIDVQDWDDFVSKTYNRPYNFQQQEGCQDRGIFEITIPEEFSEEHLPNTVPEIVNGEEMCIKFSSWLERDPNQKLENEEYSWERRLWWERNFYPHIQMVANDLHAKGLIEAGEYQINIDW